MPRKFSNVEHVMSMVIMNLSFLKERKSIREDLDLEDLEIAYMLMKKRKMKNIIRVEVKMNWSL